MALSSTTTRSRYNGDGSTTSFATGFKFLLNSHVKVVLRSSSGTETTWVEGTQYTLTGAGNANGGTVTVSTSPTDYTPASGERLIIYRDAPLTQPDALPLGGAFPSTTVEQMADRLTMIAQQLSEKIGRSLLLPVSSSPSGLSLPEPSADNVLGWNSDGTALENKTPNTSAYITLPLSVANGGTGSATAADARTALGALSKTISATQRVLGRNSSGAGDAEEVTLSQLLDWVGSAAQGDILYRGAASWARLAAGTAGQALLTQGAGANPQWGSAGLSAATQAEMEAASSNTVAVTPGRTQYHPGVAKAWVNFNGDSGGSPLILASCNVSSITDRGAAQYTVNFTTAFSSVDYAWTGAVGFNSANASGYIGAPLSTAKTTWKTASALQFNVFSANTSVHGSDPADISFIAYGDQ